METQTSIKLRPTWVDRVNELDNVQSAQILADLKEGKLQASTKHFIAGVECLENNDKTVIKKVFTDQLKIKEAKEKLALNLDSKNLKYRAIIPNKLLKEMIAGLPFYTFKTIDKKGKVKMSKENIFGDTDSLSDFTIIGGLLLTILLLSFAVSFLSSLTVLPAVLVSLLIMGGSGGIAALLDNMLGDSSKVRICISIFAAVAFSGFLPFFYFSHLKEKRIKKEVKKHIWPNMTDEDAKEDTAENKVIRVKINLPEAPMPVQERLIAWKKADYHPYLITHDSAFTVELDKEVLGKIQKKYDPIICIDKEVGGQLMTVIIDQFGDVEEEKELLERVEKYYANLKLEHSLN